MQDIQQGMRRERQWQPVRAYEELGKRVFTCWAPMSDPKKSKEQSYHAGWRALRSVRRSSLHRKQGWTCRTDYPFDRVRFLTYNLGMKGPNESNTSNGRIGQDKTNKTTWTTKQ